MNASLYQRLGGAQGIADLIDDIVDRHAANPILAPLVDCRDLSQLKSLCLASISAPTGGALSTECCGRHLAAAGMKLGVRELAEVISDVASATSERGLAPAEVREVVELLGLTKAGSEEDERKDERPDPVPATRGQP